MVYGGGVGWILSIEYDDAKSQMPRIKDNCEDADAEMSGSRRTT